MTTLTYLAEAGGYLLLIVGLWGLAVWTSDRPPS